MTDEKFLSVLEAKKACLQREMEAIDKLIATVTESLYSKTVQLHTPLFILKEIMTEVYPNKLWTRGELRMAFADYVAQQGVKSKRTSIYGMFIASLQYLIRTKRVITEGKIGTMLYSWNIK